VKGSLRGLKLLEDIRARPVGEGANEVAGLKDAREEKGAREIVVMDGLAG